ncbi:hypothetical protein [Aequorivita sp. CIP111184]|uniref:hypothetical protein n=1 Tax=Aequorivita sp. CIP111184 TaxID=2211356 RepID=UPI000DBC17ED|nr:hypothetical protein [Aequorivita sp. CIP111184]SRX52232.1 hypothetical protein AEQU1_00095 [Aequorivita sp. CIP111184]
MFEKKIFFSIMTLFLLCSCKQKEFNDIDEMITYLKMPINGYFQSKNINGIHFELMYQPTDILVYRELDSAYSKSLINLVREKYAKNLYFNLSISKEGGELLNKVPQNTDDFGALLTQLSFQMDKRIHLYNNKKDTIELADYVYPRMYGMSKTTSILFVFPKNDEFLNSEYLNFTIEDIGLKTGEIKFKIKSNDIKNEPKLIFPKS